jgi:hypothetical protein
MELTGPTLTVWLGWLSAYSIQIIGHTIRTALVCHIIRIIVTLVGPSTS